MKVSHALILLAVTCLISIYPGSAFSKELQIAQANKEMTTSKDKASKKAQESLKNKKQEQKLKGKENALERGKGEKSGLMQKMEEGKKLKNQGMGK